MLPYPSILPMESKQCWILGLILNFMSMMCIIQTCNPMVREFFPVRLILIYMMSIAPNLYQQCIITFLLYYRKQITWLERRYKMNLRNLKKQMLQMRVLFFSFFSVFIGHACLLKTMRLIFGPPVSEVAYIHGVAYNWFVFLQNFQMKWIHHWMLFAKYRGLKPFRASSWDPKVCVCIGDSL